MLTTETEKIPMFHTFYLFLGTNPGKLIAYFAKDLILNAVFKLLHL